jgi:hypothetical protein
MLAGFMCAFVTDRMYYAVNFDAYVHFVVKKTEFSMFIAPLRFLLPLKL